MPGPLTLLTPASAAMSAQPNVSAPAWASRIGPSDRAMYDWQGSSSALGHRDVRGVELERLDGGHRRRGDLHVERRRRPAEQDRRARPDDLGHGDAGQHVDRVEDRRARPS